MSKSQKDKAGAITNSYEDLKNRYSSFFQTIERLERLTLIDENEINSDSSRSKIYDPVLYGQLMDYVARFSSDKPKGTFAPVEYGDIFKAKILNANFQCDWRKDHMDLKMKKLIKMSKVLGMGYARNTYKIEKQRKNFNAVKQNGETKHVKGEYTIHDGPSCEVLSFYRVLPQMDAFDWDSQDYVFVEDWVSIDELKRCKDKGGEYQNLSKLEDMIDEIQSDDSKTQKDRSTKGSDKEVLKDLLQLDTKTGKFMMITKYTKTRWTSVAGDLLLRDIPNPYAHGDFPIIPLYNDVWYDNVVSPSESFFVERLQRAINKLINMRFDNVESIMSPMLRIGPDVDPTLLRLGQFKALEADAGDIEWFTMPDAMGQTFGQSMGILKDGISAATAAQDFSSQTKSSNPVNKFATGLRQEGDRNERRSQYHGTFIDDFVKRLADQWLSLTRQFAPTKKIVRIAGRDMVEYFKHNTMMEIDNGGATSVDDIISEGRGHLAGVLGLAYEKDEGEWEPKFRFSDDDMFGWIRLTPEDFIGNYDYIPETESTVLADKAQDRQLKLVFFETLMRTIELVKAGFLTEKSIYDLAEQFGFRNSESMFNFANVQNIISSQQAGYTGLAGGEQKSGNIPEETYVTEPLEGTPGMPPGRGPGFPANPSNIGAERGGMA